MRDLKGLLVVVVLVAITYWGVEPLAHSVMHPHVPAANFDFAAGEYEQDLAKLSNFEAALNAANKTGDEKVKKAAADEYKKAQNNINEAKAFWDEVNKIDLSKGDAKRGEEAAAACLGCHNDGAVTEMAAADPGYASVPTNLNNIAYMYDEKFLAALFKDPVKAMRISHKFGDERPFPMVTGFDDASIADLVAYFKSIAPAQMDDKAVFEEACARCHDMKYAGIKTKGATDMLKAYLGMTPPDLSMYIRSRDITYLHNFINDPQKMLEGTAMPRVGLNEKAQNQVVAYMSKVGDSKKDERESLGIKIMIYFVILSIFAILWKMAIWRHLH